jgi:hypothetical protein
MGKIVCEFMTPERISEAIELGQLAKERENPGGYRFGAIRREIALVAPAQSGRKGYNRHDEWHEQPQRLPSILSG